MAVFFGDGATDTGTFWESINYACLENLLILFVCEDNGLAVHTQDKYRRGYKNIFDVLGKFNCDVYANDGFSVEDVFTISKSAIQKVKKTQRPAFLNFKWYRQLQHVGVDNDADFKYRSHENHEEGSKKDQF